MHQDTMSYILCLSCPDLSFIVMRIISLFLLSVSLREKKCAEDDNLSLADKNLLW